MTDPESGQRNLFGASEDGSAATKRERAPTVKAAKTRPAKPAKATKAAAPPESADDSATPPTKDGDTAAHRLAAKQREISVSEFFTKNRHLLGFDNPRKALLTAIKEAVDKVTFK